MGISAGGMKVFPKFSLALLLLLVVGVVAIIWWTAPSTVEVQGPLALQRIRKAFKIEALEPAQGLARFAWPGESTQYYRFALSDGAFDALKAAAGFKDARSCAVSEVPKLVEPPDWFRWPTDLEKPQILVTEKQVVWRNFSGDVTYLFHSSVRHGCS